MVVVGCVWLHIKIVLEEDSHFFYHSNRWKKAGEEG